ncbi:protein-glutamate O-methyltransferase CheR [Acetobacteraceae bacterium H6797]|nr:protein-glutamate O-methyltransferase CheR [Acetobacteraceae bacterium H6797]
MSDGGETDFEALSEDELRRLCDFLYRQSGMAYGESKRYYITRRVNARMHETGAEVFGTYMALLRSDPGEVQRLINSFTVNETYFYREEYQFACLSRSLLPQIVARRGPGDLVRIWSMPCSTGEEAYSIAIWLLENWALVDAYHIDIIGSDIDTEVLQAAMRGEYGERALSRLPAELRRRYFTRLEEGRWQLIQDLRESVRFTQANLIDTAAMRREGGFDVIFCRNLLIYFDEASRLIAADNLHDALNPGGFLCLGHSEAMSRISDRFVTRRFQEAVVYQRPEAG